MHSNPSLSLLITQLRAWIECIKSPHVGSRPQPTTAAADLAEKTGIGSSARATGPAKRGPPLPVEFPRRYSVLPKFLPVQILPVAQGGVPPRQSVRAMSTPSTSDMSRLHALASTSDLDQVPPPLLGTGILLAFSCLPRDRTNNPYALGFLPRMITAPLPDHHRNKKSPIPDHWQNLASRCGFMHGNLLPYPIFVIQEILRFVFFI